MASKRFFSVIIPVHTRLAELEKNLAALSEQTYPADRFEVICVGMQGNPVPAFFSKKTKNFSYFAIPSRWPDAKRNAGAQKSRGDVLAFTDDDVVVARDWLEALDAGFSAHPEAAGIEGKTIGEAKRLFSHATENARGGLFPTCNLAVTRSAFDAAGGFDERYHFFREDIDLAFAVQQKAGEIVFWDRAVVVHPERRTNWRSVLNELSMFRGDVLLYKKYPVQYRKTFGWLGKGVLKQSLVAYAVLVVSAFLIRDHKAIGVIGLVMVWIAFKYFLLMRNKRFSGVEAAQFWVANAAKDVLAPLYYLKFWLEIDAKRVGSG
jgi:GT2 family glycosyltransferase